MLLDECCDSKDKVGINSNNNIHNNHHPSFPNYPARHIPIPVKKATIPLYMYFVNELGGRKHGLGIERSGGIGRRSGLLLRGARGWGLMGLNWCWWWCIGRWITRLSPSTRSISLSYLFIPYLQSKWKDSFAEVRSYKHPFARRIQIPQIKLPNLEDHGQAQVIEPVLLIPRPFDLTVSWWSLIPLFSFLPWPALRLWCIYDRVLNSNLLLGLLFLLSIAAALSIISLPQSAIPLSMISFSEILYALPWVKERSAIWGLYKEVGEYMLCYYWVCRFTGVGRHARFGFRNHNYLNALLSLRGSRIAKAWSYLYPHPRVGDGNIFPRCKIIRNIAKTSSYRLVPILLTDSI